MFHDARVWRGAVGLAVASAMLAGCALETSTSTPSPPSRTERPPARTGSANVDPAQAERLKRVMVPLLRAMNRPVLLDRVKVGIMDDQEINAANAGNGEFYVTLGLLQKANDGQLTAIMAHEIAHEDLGHVAKAQRLGAGLNIGMVILDQIFPGSGNLTPIAGALVSRAYSRNEEYQADAHGVTLLERTGQPKQLMIDTLTWLMQTAGASGGDFFATHPATEDRIEALKKTASRQ